MLLLTLGLAPAAHAAAEPRNVLLLYSYEREFTHKEFAGLFRPELSRSSAEPINYIEVALQTAGESTRAPDDSIVTRLHSTFGSTPLDLVVAIGGPASAFAQAHRTQLFATTPMLFAAVDRRFIEKGTMADNDTAVAVAHDPPQMIETILKLLPATRTIVVVIGASQLEQFWLKEVQRAFKRFEGRVNFVWTNDWSFTELLQRSATLPARSAIFFGVFAVDAAGVPHIEERTLRELHGVANAPIFGLHSTQLSRGIVGGPLLSIDELSRTAAGVALRMLRGEAPRSIVTPIQVAGSPSFDWRELQRWGIGEDRLAAGSTVQFREPAVWQRYRRPIVTGAAVAGVQAVVMIALTANLVKRRRQQASLRLATLGLSNLSRRLMQVCETEREWIGRELHEDLCQRLMALTMNLHSLGDLPDSAAGEMRRRVADLTARFSQLTGEILSISDRIHGRLELLGLATVARRFCEHLSAEHQAPIDFRDDRVPDRLNNDIALAVFRVLEEAVTNALRYSGARHVSVSLEGSDSEIRLEVSDDGVGFDPEAVMKDRGLGLIAMRERLLAVGGEFAISSRSGAGTRVLARAPIRRRGDQA